MSDEREDLLAESEAAAESTAADDVEILGIEAVDEIEPDSGVFDFVGSEESDEDEGGPAGAGGPGEAELQVRLARAEDRNLRLLADFDNFRKRADRERQESARHALADVMRELLPVVDNLERALASSGGTEELRKGVEMIVRQFLEVLRRFDVEPVPAVGRTFDPKIHEAVQSTESTDVEHPTVAEEYQRGYLLRGRLIRPALVRVALPPDPGHEGAE